MDGTTSGKSSGICARTADGHGIRSLMGPSASQHLPWEVGDNYPFVRGARDRSGAFWSWMMSAAGACCSSRKVARTAHVPATNATSARERVRRL
jgi:hypothetical protein